MTKHEFKICEAVERYEKFQRAKGIRGDSLNVFLNALRAFEPLYGRPISEIRNSEISEAFLAENERKNPTTYNNNKTLVSSFFNYVVNVLEALPGNPVAKAIPRRKRVKPPPHLPEPSPPQMYGRPMNFWAHSARLTGPPECAMPPWSSS